MSPAETLSRNLAAFAIQPDGESALRTADTPRLRVEQRNETGVLLWRRPAGGWAALNSGRDPIGEANRWLDDAGFVDGGNAAIVIGAGLGYVIDAIERRSPTARVVVFEPCPETARALLEARDWSCWFAADRLRLLVGPDYAGDHTAWQLLDGAELEPPVVRHPLLAADLPLEMAAASAAAARLLFAARSNATARRENAGRYLVNTLRNLTPIMREADVAGLRALLPGRPGVVISAGPSLDRNLSELRALGGRAVLIAVDTAVRPLLAAGIAPHLVVALDPTWLNAGHLLNLPDAPGLHLVAEASLHPQALAAFAGRTFLFQVSNHHPWPWLAAAGVGCGSLQVWGSVATAGFDLARQLGCDPIVFCGQDLAYTDGRSYCAGTTWEPWLPSTPPVGSLALPGVDGHPTPTAGHLVSFRDWLVAESLRDSRRYVNASGAGILFGGRIELASLSTALGACADLGAAVVTEALASAHRSGANRHSALPSAATRVLGDLDRGALGEEPILAWSQFAGPAAGVDAIGRALRAGLAGGCPPAGDPTQAALMNDLHASLRPEAADGPPLDRILRAFQQLGRDAGLSSTAVLSRRDLARLLALSRTPEPRRVLLLDCGPGVTSLVVSAHAPASASIEARPPHRDRVGIGAVIGTAAMLAGVADRITWTPQPSGTFDLVVATIDDDGHSGHAGTIADALAWVAPEGTLAVADVTSSQAASAVRATVASLAAPEVGVSPDPHADWLSRLFIVRRRPRASAVTDDTRLVVAAPADIDASTLANLVAEQFKPSCVTVLGRSAADWAGALKARGLDARGLTGLDAIDDRTDLALCLDMLEYVPPGAEDAAVARAAAAADTVVFSIPPPGYTWGDYLNQRPAAFWLDRFLALGYVFVDQLRSELEDRPDFGRRPFDFCLYVVRRISDEVGRNAIRSCPELRSLIAAASARIERLYLDAALHRLQQRDAAACAPDSLSLRTLPFIHVPIPASDMEREAGHRFRVRFADTRARLCLGAGVFATATVEEDGVPLPHAQMRLGDIAEPGLGRYWIGLGQLYFSTCDNSDPRVNGRTYSLRLPAHLARLAMPA